MDELQKAKNAIYESWDIFSKTGDPQDARLLIDSIARYDELSFYSDDDLEM